MINSKLLYPSSLKPFILYGLLVVAPFVSQAQKNDKANKPNVIYIFADDLGYGELGSYGQQKIKTPHLDKLAAEGMRFTQHYTGTPVCAPSRYNLMTGLHAGHSLIRNNGGGKEDEDGPKASALPDSTITIAKLFKKAGYSTAAVGKWGLGNQNNSGNPLRQGFDRFYGFYSQTLAHNHYPDHLYNNDKKQSLNNPVIDVHPKLKKNEVQPADVEKYKGTDYATDRMTTNAIEFINDNKKKPFFLYLAYTLPHVALQAPEAAIEYYKKMFNEQPELYLRGYVPTYYPKSTYAAMVTYLDKQVGLVMGLLKKNGLDKNTIILFCSDNGPAQLNSDDGNFFNSTAGLRGIKRDLYEGGIREPFIVKWPGKVKAGAVSQHISATYDMMATFSDLLKVPAPANDGISILSTLLSDTKQQQHEFLYWEFPERGGQVAVRMGKWKGIKVGFKKQKEPKWQLYDLDADRSETNDVASKHPEILKRLDEIVQKEHTPSVRNEWNF